MLRTLALVQAALQLDLLPQFGDLGGNLADIHGNEAEDIRESVDIHEAGEIGGEDIRDQDQEDVIDQETALGEGDTEGEVIGIVRVLVTISKTSEPPMGDPTASTSNSAVAIDLTVDIIIKKRNCASIFSVENAHMVIDANLRTPTARVKVLGRILTMKQKLEDVLKEEE